MREILFRGQTRKYGEKVRIGDGQKLPGRWVYGGVLQGSGSHSIIYGGENINDPSQSSEKWCVHTDTLGQYTGLKDKHGKRIFEGDIVKADNGAHSSISVVKFGEYFPKMFYDMLAIYYPVAQHLNANGFYLESTKHEDMILFKSRHLEVIGNIHDNPELLEK